MIVQSLIQWVADGITALLGLFPTWEAPTWQAQALDFWTTSIESVNGLAQWFPLPLIGIVAIAVFASLAVSIGIKLFRIVASFLTLGGGSAA